MAAPTVYSYDPTTGLYLGSSQATQSPLDPPGIWLYPAHTTLIAPPTAGPGQAAYFSAKSGSWSLASAKLASSSPERNFSMISAPDLVAIFHRLADEIEKADAAPRSEVAAKAVPAEPEIPPKPTIDLSTVKGIQQAINSLRAPNYPRLEEDGMDSPMLVWALKETQAALGIPMTGQADQITIDALQKALVKP